MMTSDDFPSKLRSDEEQYLLLLYDQAGNALGMRIVEKQEAEQLSLFEGETQTKAASFHMATLSSSLQPQHITRVLLAVEANQEEQTLFEQVRSEVHRQKLTVTNYKPDQAIREATLAPEEEWIEEQTQNTLMYHASNNLHVYLGTPENPLPVQEALENIRRLNETTALTARIVMGLWHIRREQNLVTKNGSVPVLPEEILEWRGIQKRTRAVYPGATKRYQDGYRTEQKQHVLQDLALLAACNVRGSANIKIRGRSKKILIDGQYLRMSAIRAETVWGEQDIIGLTFLRILFGILSYNFSRGFPQAA